MTENDRIPERMTAAAVPEPGAPLRLAEVPVPKPLAGQVLVEVAFAGVNHIDLLIAAGQVPADPAARGVLGLEASGTVVALGQGVDRPAVGERVAWMGGLDAACYARYAVVDASRTAPVPPALGLEEAACIPVAATTAQHLIALAPGERGRHALVHAATGGIGLVLVQLLVRQGFEVTALTRSEDKHGLLREAGAYRVEVMHDGRVPPLVRPVDVSFNAVGGATVADDIAALAPYGTVVLYGLFAGPPQQLGESLVGAWNKSAALRCADIFTQYLHRRDAHRAALVEGLRLAAAGELALPRGQTRALSDAAGALAQLAAHGARGKVLLRP